MVMNDPLAAALSKLNNAERAQRKDVVEVRSSKTIKAVLTILKDAQYVKDFEVVPRAQGDIYTVTLTKNINNVGVIKPRFAFKNNEWEKVEKQYLPSQGFGIIIVSTSQGMMTLQQAKEKNIGGKLLAYCY